MDNHDQHHHMDNHDQLHASIDPKADDESTTTLIHSLDVSSSSSSHGTKSAFDLLDDALDDLGTGRFQHKLLFVTGFGQFFDAAESALIALIYPMLASEWDASRSELALIGSMTGLGMMIGATSLGRVSDVVGRKRAYEASLFVCALFALLSSFATGIRSFALLRFVLGIGYGGNMIACTTLLVEYIKGSDRGMYVSFAGVAYGLGALGASAFSWMCMEVIGWRWVVRCVSLLAIPILVTLVLIPESVRYLVAQREFGRAVDALRVVAEANCKPLPKYFTQERLAGSAVTGGATAAAPLSVKTWGAFFSREAASLSRIAQRPILKTLVPLTFVWFLNSFSSQIFYWIPLQAKTQFPTFPDAEYKINFLISLAAFIGGIIAVPLTARVPRLTLLRVGTLSSALCMALLGQSTGWYVGYCAATFALQVCYAIVANTLYLYSPEAFPTSIRVTAFGMCMFGHRIAPSFAPYVVAWMLNDYGFGAACTVLAGVHAVGMAMSHMLSVRTFNAALVE